MLAARSLKVGAIRLTERFFGKEPVKRKAVDDARKFVKSYLPRVEHMVADAGGFEVAVGSSGTILNVAEMVRARRGAEPLRQVGDAGITADELTESSTTWPPAPRAPTGWRCRGSTPAGPTSSSAA